MKKISYSILCFIMVNHLNVWSFSAEPDSLFFKKAVPVWIDSRYSTKNKEGRYEMTTAGRHYGKQTEKNLTVYFRAIITGTGLQNPMLRLTASSNYRVSLNGHFLGHGPCVAAHDYYRVDEYELKDKLVPGENIIAIEVTGYNIYNYYVINQPAFLQAEITDGGKILATTKSQGEGDPLFQATLLEQRVQDVPIYCFQRTFIESYQLKPTFKDWMTVKEDSSFQSLKLERTSGKTLIPRRVKYPDYSIRRPVENRGDSLYRFECNSTGFIGVQVNATTHTKITLSWDEILDDQELLKPERLKTLNYIYYELEPGTYTLESFEPYTLQYLQVKVEQGTCKVTSPYIRQYVNSDISEASFNCSDPAINKIFKAAVETYKQNALDIFMDCPSRERAGWLCDSYFMGRVAFNLSGNTLIETNFLENFLLPDKFEFIPEGMLPMCYPSDHPNANYIPNWAMWFVLELQEYLERSGNRELVEAAKPRVMALLDYFKAYENEFGLLENLEKWIFVEWSKANSFVQDVNYPTNMLYARMLSIVSALYDQPDLQEKAFRIQQTIREQSYNGNFFTDNAIRVDGKLIPQTANCTETCQYYAFFLGTATPEKYPELWNTLIRDFGPERVENNIYPEIYPSNAFIGNYLRLELLSRQELVKQLLHESVDRFLYMADKTGTLWENVHTRASLNHGFASHIAHVFYRDLLGVKSYSLQKRHIFIEFHDTDIQSCSGTIPLGDEQFYLHWKKEGNRLLYSYTAPSGYQVQIQNKTPLTLQKE